MPNCPDCGEVLLRDRNEIGLFWACPQNHGWALTLSYLRQSTTQETSNEIWAKVKNAGERAGRPCGSCGKPSVVLPAPSGSAGAEICPLCQSGWFTGEFLQSLPPPPPKPVVVKEELPEAVRTMLAKAQVQQIAERQQDKSTLGKPDHWWQYLLGMAGFPIRLGRQEEVKSTPKASYYLAGAVLGVSTLCLYVPDLVPYLGWVPDDTFRTGGLSLLTNFFVHAGPFHLLGNLYVLLLVSSQVEEDLGHKKYLLLMFFSVLGADLLDLLFLQSPHTVRIGASGGLFGLLAFFSFRFPRARFGFFIPIRFVFIKLPAFLFTIFWLFMIWFLSNSSGGKGGGINHLAHLGGFLTGLVVWFFWGRGRQEESFK